MSVSRAPASDAGAIEQERGRRSVLPWLGAALLAALVVGVAQARTRGPLAWDEAVRVSQGNILEHALRIGDLGGAWQWLNQQTFYPFVGATLNGLALLITRNSVTSAWMPSLIAYALAGILAGRLAAALGGRAIGAWVAAILTWLAPLEARLAAGAFTEPIGACVLLLLLWLLVQMGREQSIYLAIATGLTVAAAWFVKYDYGVLATATLGVAAVPTLVRSRTRRVWIQYGIAAVCAAALLAIWMSFNFDAKLREMRLFIGQGTPGKAVGPDLLYYLRTLWSGGEVGLSVYIASLFAAGFIWAVVSLKSRSSFLIPVVFVTLWYVLYSFTGNARYPRYMGPVLPVLASLSGVAIMDWWLRLRSLPFRRTVAAAAVAVVAVSAWQLYEQSAGPSGLDAQFSFIRPDQPAAAALAFAADALKDQTRPVLMIGQANELSSYALQLAWSEQLGHPAPFPIVVPEAEPTKRRETFLQTFAGGGEDVLVGLDIQPGSRLDSENFRMNFASQPDYIRMAGELEQQGLLQRVATTAVDSGRLQVIVWNVPSVHPEHAAQSAGACASAGLTAKPATPQPSGTTVTLTANSKGCTGTPQYRFSIYPPGGPWTPLQDYSAGATATWDTAGLALGTYNLAVTVRSQDSTVDRETDAYAGYTIGRVSINCISVHLTVGPAQPQPAGMAIALRAESSGCSGTPEYRFTVLPPGGNWTVLQDYSTSSTVSWGTTGLAAGSYSLAVTVRSQGSALDREQTDYVPYLLTAR